MKNLIKKINTILIIVAMIIIQIPNRYVKATEEIDRSKDKIEAINNAGLKIEVDKTNYKTERTIDLIVSFKNLERDVIAFDTYIEYDKEKFEEISKDNFTFNLKDEEISSINYEKSINKLAMDLEDDTKVEEIFRLKLKLKDGIEMTGTTDILLRRPVIYSYILDIEEILPDKEVGISLDEKENVVERETLYLTSEKYKVGPEYMTRIISNTNLEDFINEPNTNGTIRILKEDGTELTLDELIGTGMRLIDTRENEKIELIIAVWGDLDGDGKATISDLSTATQVKNGVINLKTEAQRRALDFAESGEPASISNISELNHLLLK